MRVGGLWRGFVWSGGNWSVLNPPDGSGSSYAQAVNTEGKVVGWRNHANAERIAYLYFNGTFTDILPTYGDQSEARDVNDNDEVVGSMEDAPLDYRAFLWQGDKAIELPMPEQSLRASAFALNNKTEVVGITVFPNPRPGYDFARATLWNHEEVAVLGALPGFSNSVANDINNHTTIVGRCYSPDRGFIWHNGAMHDLNAFVDTSVIFIRNARAINDAGQIVASATLSGLPAMAVLSPIWPEPGDATCDEVVDVDDLLQVVNQWGECDVGLCRPDFNHDELVDSSDLLMVLENWSSK